VALMVLLALIPFLALSSALGPLSPFIAGDLHMSRQEFNLSTGLANAAYAVGTVLAVMLSQHLPQRRMLIVYASLLVLGSVLAAGARDPGMYIAGHVLQGLCTSLMLIAAVPPLATGFSAGKLQMTAVIMDLCIFGAVALGPAVGGLQANSQAWRPLFWVIVAVAAGALIMAILTFEDSPAENPDSPKDPLAIMLAAIGCVAAFFGASELLTHHFLSAETAAPLFGGVAIIFLLVVYQYRAKAPLLTVREMLVSTMPVAGIVVALCAAAASVSVTALTAEALDQRYGPLHVGLLYLPEVGGAVITAVVFGAVLRSRALHYLPLVGMLFLAAGIAVFRIKVPSSEAATLIGAGLTGVGLGATVAPALFVAGFSLPASGLSRVFAVVELMRGVAAFMIAPIFVHFAATVGGSLDAGVGTALWIGLGISLGGAVIAVMVYALGGARPVGANAELFLAGEQPGWYSPPLLARVRGLTPPTPTPATPTPTEPAEPARPTMLTHPTAPGEPPHITTNPDTTTLTTPGQPILLTYDGTTQAAHALAEAGTQLTNGTHGTQPHHINALVLCVWQPNDLGFIPTNPRHIDAGSAAEVKRAAEETATYGATLAQQAGFHAESLTIEATPTWQGIITAAETHHASLIVLGSHHHNALNRHLLGSIAASVTEHAQTPVMIIPPED
jgi:nucleotide-binding universal stress UspA family protein/MFS family permease